MSKLLSFFLLISCAGAQQQLQFDWSKLAAKAVEMMERYSITTLVVSDNAKRIAGVVHLHDLLKHGIF